MLEVIAPSLAVIVVAALAWDFGRRFVETIQVNAKWRAELEQHNGTFRDLYQGQSTVIHEQGKRIDELAEKFERVETAQVNLANEAKRALDDMGTKVALAVEGKRVAGATPGALRVPIKKRN